MTHRPCLDAVTEAMALPIVAVPDQAPPGAESVGAAIRTAQGPPRQQGRIQDYERRAG